MESNYQPQNNTPMYQPQNELPMKWFKFLIFFSLFASAVLNTISGIIALTGAQYEQEYKGAKELVYAYFEGLQTVDMIYGVALIAIAAFAIYVRVRLAGYYANGPKLLNVLYLANAGFGLFYIIALQSIVGSDVNLDMTSAITSIITSVVMVGVNTVYFKKRAHLFVKN